MRKIYFWFSLFFALIGVITAFANITTSAPIWFWFSRMGSGGMFTPLLIITFIGFISGVFFGLALMAKEQKGMDDVDL